MEKIFSGVLCTAVLGEVLVGLLPGGSLKRFARVGVGLLVSLMLLKSLVGCGGELPVATTRLEEENFPSSGQLIEDVYRGQLTHRNSQNEEVQK